jgi:methylamine dehydrogenase accessory protein MauD
MSWLVWSNVGLLAALSVLAFVVIVLARQIGVLHERTAPAGADLSAAGVADGAHVPAFSAPTLSGVATRIGRGRNVTLLFVAAECPVCRSVSPAFARALRENPELDGYWVSDGSEIERYAEYAELAGIDPDRYLLSMELALTLQIRQIPALAVVRDGVLVAREVLASGKQLLALFDAHRVESPVQGGEVHA